jgi:hypothetical protein
LQIRSEAVGWVGVSGVVDVATGVEVATGEAPPEHAASRMAAAAVARNFRGSRFVVIVGSVQYSGQLPADGCQIVPDGLSDDPTIADLKEPQHAVAQPPTAAVDIECPPGQATGPDVLVDDEIPSVPSSDGDVAFVDGRRKEVAITAPDGFQSVDRFVGETDDLMHDAFGHRCEDPLDVAVVFCPKLSIDESIEAGPFVCIEVLRRQHATHHGPAR